MARGLHPARNVLLLNASQFVGDLGGTFSTIAIPATIVLALHATPLQIGAFDAISTGTIPLCAIVAGVVADRSRTRPLLVASNIVRLAALALVPLAIVCGHASMGLFFIVAAVVAAASAVFDAAYASFVPRVIGEARIASGTSRLAASTSLAEAFGTGVAGVLVMTIGAPLVVLINVATSLLATLALSSIRIDEPRKRIRATTSTRLEVREGLRAVLAHPTLRRVTYSNAVAHFGGGMTAAVTTAFVYRELHLTPAAFGLVMGLANVGALAAFYAARIAARAGMTRTLAGAHLVSGLGNAALPLLAGLFPLVALAVSRTLLTAAGPVFAVNDTSLRLALVPDALRGRATATALPLGSLAGGFLGGCLGLHATMLVGAALTASAALFFSARPSLACAVASRAILRWSDARLASRVRSRRSVPSAAP